ncbi:PH domain-containing protein [Flavobacterium sp. XN-5]|uniref:PH domain-containing protein n=1 Tax=Flavobacterium sp. XN-5 TaxID=2599390 RepID=UPI0011C7B7BF|nr:PH domain-containing protein [Flavobacterium sp. XN-5]NGY38739.1 PH domain-containing protein [Flavobacterium sp. XN-5]
MENFSNETIDTTQLPKFEEVQFSVLHSDYWKVSLLNVIIFFLITGTGLGLLLFFNRELLVFAVEISVAYFVLLSIVLLLSRISFKKKGFAFRTHDVLFRYGIIATNTIVIPYNRVQHVALHEGLLSRYFGLAKVEVFTAGGSSSDIEIPGIKKEQAENIKQLLMGKIQKQL